MIIPVTIRPPGKIQALDSKSSVTSEDILSHWRSKVLLATEFSNSHIFKFNFNPLIFFLLQDHKKFQRTEWVTLEWNTDHWRSRYVAKRKWRLQIPSHFAVRQMWSVFFFPVFSKQKLWVLRKSHCDGWFTCKWLNHLYLHRHHADLSSVKPGSKFRWWRHESTFPRSCVV